MPEKELPENLIRKVSKTTLHAAEKGRYSLFEKLTAANAEKIAAVMQEKPILYEHKEDAPTQILLDEEIEDALPKEFSDNPTQWIESQPMVQRGDEMGLPTGTTIAELWDKPYDVSKVKQFSVKLPNGRVKQIISKRIEQKQLQEIALARKAHEAGIPTAKVLGEVIDKGNTYALFERLPGINLNAAINKLRERGAFKGLLDYYSIFYITEDEEFKKFIKQEAGAISEAGREKIYKIWRKALPDIIRKEIIMGLSPSLPFVNYEQTLKRIEQRLEIGRFSQKDISAALSYLGYKSLDDYINTIIHLPFKKLAALLKTIEESREVPGGKKLKDKLMSEIRKDIFGFDYAQEIKKLESLCKERGIVHKDFEKRNMVILWDFENDRPLPREPKEPKLYIIDWEQRVQNRVKED